MEMTGVADAPNNCVCCTPLDAAQSWSNSPESVCKSIQSYWSCEVDHAQFEDWRERA
jgi:hypothetical protein